MAQHHRGYYQQEQSSSNFQNLLNKGGTGTGTGTGSTAGGEQIVRFRPQLYGSSYVVPNKNNSSPPPTIKAKIIEAKASVVEEGVKLGRHDDDDNHGPELHQSNKTTNKNNNNNNHNKREEQHQQFITKLQDEAIKAINRTTLLGSTPAGIVDHSNQDQYRRPALSSSSSSSPSNTTLLGSTLQAPIVNHLNQDQYPRPASSSGNLIPSKPTTKLLQEKEPNYSSPLIDPHPPALKQPPLIHNNNYILKTDVHDPNHPERKDFAHRVINWRKPDYYQGRNWPINPLPKTQDPHHRDHHYVHHQDPHHQGSRYRSPVLNGGYERYPPQQANGSSSYGYYNINGHTSTAVISSDQAANKYNGAFIL